MSVETGWEEWPTIVSVRKVTIVRVGNVIVKVEEWPCESGKCDCEDGEVTIVRVGSVIVIVEKWPVRVGSVIVRMEEWSLLVWEVWLWGWRSDRCEGGYEVICIHTSMLTSFGSAWLARRRVGETKRQTPLVNHWSPVWTDHHDHKSYNTLARYMDSPWRMSIISTERSSWSVTTGTVHTDPQLSQQDTQLQGQSGEGHSYMYLAPAHRGVCPVKN